MNFIKIKKQKSEFKNMSEFERWNLNVGIIKISEKHN